MKSKGKMRINPNTKKPWARGEKKEILYLKVIINILLIKMDIGV